jgi:hypothetical protein
VSRNEEIVLTLPSGEGDLEDIDQVPDPTVHSLVEFDKSRFRGFPGRSVSLFLPLQGLGLT